MKLLKYRHLFRLLVARDLRERYAGSWLGLSWTLIQPAVLFAIYDMVFSHILHLRPDPAFGNVSFPIWLMAGMAPWLCLLEVLNRSPTAVTDHASMVANNAFPNGLLPSATVVSALANHVLTLSVLCVFFAWKGVLNPWAPLALLPWLALLALLVGGIAWLFAGVGVYFRDLAQLAGLLALAWSFATPIFYPESAVSPRLSFLVRLNPAFAVVRGYRMALLGRQGLFGSGLGMAALWAAGLCAAGFLSFGRLKRGFPDLL